MLPATARSFSPVLKGIASLTVFALTLTTLLPPSWAAPQQQKDHLRGLQGDEATDVGSGLEEALGADKRPLVKRPLSRREFLKAGSAAAVGLSAVGLEPMPQKTLATQPQDLLELQRRFARGYPKFLPAAERFLEKQRITGVKPMMPANLPPAVLERAQLRYQQMTGQPFSGFDFNGFYREYAPGARDKFLTDYGRTWIYTQALVLYDWVMRKDRKEAQALADALVRLGKQEEALGFEGGWHFSYNTIGNPWLDPRAPTGNNLLALSALYAYMLAFRDFTHLGWVNRVRKQVLEDLQVMDEKDIRQGFVQGMRYTAALDQMNPKTGKRYVIDEIGYRAYEGNVNQIAGDIATEHQFDAANTLRKAYLANEAVPRQHRAKATDGEMAALVTSHRLLMNNLMKLWVEDPQGGNHFITGIHYNQEKSRWELNRSVAVDNNSWAGVVLPYSEELAWQAIEYVRKHFVIRQPVGKMQDLPQATRAQIQKGRIDSKEEVTGLSFFALGFNDRFIEELVSTDDPDRVLWAQMLQPEATFGLIHFLIRFAEQTSDEKRRKQAQTLAEELMQGIMRLHELYGGEGLPYATLAPELFTTLRSTTATATGTIVFRQFQASGGQHFLMVEPPEPMRDQIELAPRETGPLTGLRTGLEEEGTPETLSVLPVAAPLANYLPLLAVQATAGPSAKLRTGLEEGLPPNARSGGGLTRRDFLGVGAAAVGTAALGSWFIRSDPGMPTASEGTLPNVVMVSGPGPGTVLEQFPLSNGLEVPLYLHRSDIPITASQLPSLYLWPVAQGNTTPKLEEATLSSIRVRSEGQGADQRWVVDRAVVPGTTTLVPPGLFMPAETQEVNDWVTEALSQIWNGTVKRWWGEQDTWQAPDVGGKELAVPLWDPWVFGLIPQKQAQAFYTGMAAANGRILYGTHGAIGWKGYAARSSAWEVAAEVTRHLKQMRRAGAKVSPLMGAKNWTLPKGRTDALQHIELVGRSYPLFNWDQAYLDMEVWTTQTWEEAAAAGDEARLQDLAWDWYQFHRDALDRLPYSPVRLHTFVQSPATDDTAREPHTFTRVLRRALDARKITWDDRIVPVPMAYTPLEKLADSLAAARRELGVSGAAAFELQADPSHPATSLYDSFKRDSAAAQAEVRKAVAASGSQTVVLEVAGTRAALTLGTQSRVPAYDRWLNDPVAQKNLREIPGFFKFAVGEPLILPVEERAWLPVPESVGQGIERDAKSFAQGIQTGPAGAAAPYRMIQMMRDIIRGNPKVQLDAFPLGTESMFFHFFRMLQGYFETTGQPRVIRVELVQGEGDNARVRYENMMGSSAGIFLPEIEGQDLHLRVWVERDPRLEAWRGADLFIYARLGASYAGSGAETQLEEERRARLLIGQRQGYVDVPVPESLRNGIIHFNFKLYNEDNRIVDWVGSSQDPWLLASGWPTRVDEYIGKEGLLWSQFSNLDKPEYRSKTDDELRAIGRHDFVVARNLAAQTEIGVITGGRLLKIARVLLDEAGDAKLEQHFQVLRASGYNLVSLRIPNLEAEVFKQVQRSDLGIPARQLFSVQKGQAVFQKILAITQLANRYGLDVHIEVDADELRKVTQSPEAKERERRAAAGGKKLRTATDVVGTIIERNDRVGLGLAGFILRNPTAQERLDAEIDIINRIDAPLIIAGPAADAAHPDRVSNQKSLYAEIVPMQNAASVLARLKVLADQPSPEIPPRAHDVSKTAFVEAPDLKSAAAWHGALPVFSGSDAVKKAFRERIRVPTADQLLQQGLVATEVNAAQTFAKTATQAELDEALQDLQHPKRALAVAVTLAWAAELERIQDIQGQPRFATDVETAMASGAARIRPLPLLYATQGWSEVSLAVPPDQAVAENNSAPIIVNLTHHGDSPYGFYKVTLALFHHGVRQRFDQTVYLLLKKDQTHRHAFRIDGLPPGLVNYRVTAISSAIERTHGWLSSSLNPLQRTESIDGGVISVGAAEPADGVDLVWETRRQHDAQQRVIGQVDQLAVLGQPNSAPEAQDPAADEQRLTNRLDLWVDFQTNAKALQAGADVSPMAGYSAGLQKTLDEIERHQTDRVNKAIQQDDEDQVDLVASRKQRSIVHRTWVWLILAAMIGISGPLGLRFLRSLAEGGAGWAKDMLNWFSPPTGPPPAARPPAPPANPQVPPGAAAGSGLEEGPAPISRETAGFSMEHQVSTTSGGDMYGREHARRSSDLDRFRRIHEVGTHWALPTDEYAQTSMTIRPGEPAPKLPANDAVELADFAQEQIGRWLLRELRTALGRRRIGEFELNVRLSGRFTQGTDWSARVIETLRRIDPAANVGALQNPPANAAWVKVQFRLPDAPTEEVGAQVKLLWRLAGAPFVRSRRVDGQDQIDVDRKLYRLSAQNDPAELAAHFQRIYADSAKRRVPHREQGVWIAQDFMAEMYGRVDHRVREGVIAPPIHLDWRPWTVVERAFGGEVKQKSGGTKSHGDLIAEIRDHRKQGVGFFGILRDLFWRDIKRYISVPALLAIGAAYLWLGLPAVPAMVLAGLALAKPLMIWGMRFGLEKRDRPAMTPANWSPTLILENWGLWGGLALAFLIFGAPALTIVVGLGIIALVSRGVSVIASHLGYENRTGWDIPILIVGAALAYFLTPMILTLLPGVGAVSLFSVFAKAWSASLWATFLPALWQGLVGLGAGTWVVLALLGGRMTLLLGFYTVHAVDTALMTGLAVIAASMRLFGGDQSALWNGPRVIHHQWKIMASDLLVPLVVLWQVMGYESSMTMRKLMDQVARFRNVLHPAGFGLGIVVLALVGTVVGMPVFIPMAIGAVMMTVTLVLNGWFILVEREFDRINLLKDPGRVLGILGAIAIGGLLMWPPALLFIQAHAGAILLAAFGIHLVPAMLVWLAVSFRTIGRFGEAADLARRQFLQQNPLGQLVAGFDGALSRFHGLFDILFLLRDSSGVPMTLSEPEITLLGTWDQRGRWYQGDILVKMGQWVGSQIGRSMMHWRNLRYSQHEEFSDMIWRLRHSRDHFQRSSGFWRLFENPFMEKWTGMSGTPPLVGIRDLDPRNKADSAMADRFDADIAPSFHGANGYFVSYIAQPELPPGIILPHTVAVAPQPLGQAAGSNVVSLVLEPRIWGGRFVMRGNPQRIAKGQKLAALRSWMYGEGSLAFTLTPDEVTGELQVHLPLSGEEQYRFHSEEALPFQRHLQTAVSALRDDATDRAGTQVIGLTPSDYVFGHDPEKGLTLTERGYQALTTQVVPLAVPPGTGAADIDAPITAFAYMGTGQGAGNLINTREPSESRQEFLPFDAWTLDELQVRVNEVGLEEWQDPVLFAGAMAQQIMAGLKGHPFTKVFLHGSSTRAVNPQTELTHTHPETGRAEGWVKLLDIPYRWAKAWGFSIKNFGQRPTHLQDQENLIPVLLGMDARTLGKKIVERYIQERQSDRTELPLSVWIRQISPIQPDADDFYRMMVDERSDLGGKYPAHISRLHERVNDSAEVRRWAKLQYESRVQDGLLPAGEFALHEQEMIREAKAAMRETADLSPEFTKRRNVRLYDARSVGHRLVTGLVNGLAAGIVAGFVWSNPFLGLLASAMVGVWSFVMTPATRAQRGWTLFGVGTLAAVGAMWASGTLWSGLLTNAAYWGTLGLVSLTGVVVIAGAFMLMTGIGLVSFRPERLLSLVRVGIGIPLVATIAVVLYLNPAVAWAMAFGGFVGIWSAYSNGMVPAMWMSGGRNWKLMGWVTFAAVFPFLLVFTAIPAGSAVLIAGAGGVVAAVFFRALNLAGPPYSLDAQIIARLFGKEVRQFDGFWDSSTWKRALGLPFMEGLQYFRLILPGHWGGILPAEAPGISTLEALTVLSMDRRLAPVSAFNLLALKRAYAIMERLTKAEDTLGGYVGVAEVLDGQRRGASPSGAPMPPAAGIFREQEMVYLAGELNHLDAAIRRAAEPGVGEALRKAQQRLFENPLLTGQDSIHRGSLIGRQGKTGITVLDVRRFEKTDENDRVILNDRWVVKRNGQTASEVLVTDRGGRVVKGPDDLKGQTLTSPYLLIDNLWGLRAFETLQMRWPPLERGVPAMINNLSGWTLYRLNMDRVAGQFAPGWFENAWEAWTIFEKDFSAQALEAMQKKLEHLTWMRNLPGSPATLRNQLATVIEDLEKALEGWAMQVEPVLEQLPASMNRLRGPTEGADPFQILADAASTVEALAPRRIIQRTGLEENASLEELVGRAVVMGGSADVNQRLWSGVHPNLAADADAGSTQTGVDTGLAGMRPLNIVLAGYEAAADAGLEEPEPLPAEVGEIAATGLEQSPLVAPVSQISLEEVVGLNDLLLEQVRSPDVEVSMEARGVHEALKRETRVRASQQLSGVQGIYAASETAQPVVFLLDDPATWRWAVPVAQTGAPVAVLTDRITRASGLEELFESAGISPERYAVISEEAFGGDRQAALKVLQERFGSGASFRRLPPTFHVEEVETFLREHGVVFLTDVSAGLEEVEKHLQTLA